jgi:hypothetical protein
METKCFTNLGENQMEIEKNLSFISHDHTVAKNVAEHLEKKYPGWLWAVNVMDGLVVVKCMRLSGNWGFVLHEEKIDNDYKAVTQAGGEILERFRQKTESFKRSEDNYSELQMDNVGRLNGDYS